MLFLMMSQALAQTVTAEPASIDQVIGMVPTLISFVKHGQFLLVGASITLVLVFFIKQYLLARLKLGTGVLPLLSAVLGIIVGLAVAVLGGATGGAALLAVLSGPAASTAWDAILKFFFPKPVVTVPVLPQAPAV